MSELWDLESLVRPLSEERASGEDIEYTLLPEFDTFRVFGRSGPYEQPPDERTQDRQQPPPDWGKIQARSVEVLQKSKDLRVLAHLGAAVLRTRGIVAFTTTLAAAASWLDRYWSEIYPLVEDGDVVSRRNAINYFADPIAFVDGLRRAALVTSRQHGSVTVRDVEITAGQMPSAGGDAATDQARIDAAFAAVPMEELQQLSDSVATAQSALTQIDVLMREKGGEEGAPELEPLVLAFGRVARIVSSYRETRIAATALAMGGDAAGGDWGAAGGPAGMAMGAIRSREDAIRALDAVAEFFKRSEPSSPVPMFLERAKRLVSKNFLEVLADVAPDALAQARAAGGVRDE